MELAEIASVFVEIQTRNLNKRKKSQKDHFQ